MYVHIFICHRISIYPISVLVCAILCNRRTMENRRLDIIQFSYVNCTTDWNQRLCTGGASRGSWTPRIRLVIRHIFIMNGYLWMPYITNSHTRNECNVCDLIKSWIIECVRVHTHIKIIICIAKHCIRNANIAKRTSAR